MNEPDFELSFADLIALVGEKFHCPYCEIETLSWADADGGIDEGTPAICLMCGHVYTLGVSHGSPWLNPAPPMRLTVTTVNDLRNSVGFQMESLYDDEEEVEYVN